MATANTSGFVELSFTNEEQVAMLKAVLQYEAAVRGLTVGQAFADIVMSAANSGHYPADMVDYLREIKEDARTQAIGEARIAASLPISA